MFLSWLIVTITVLGFGVAVVLSENLKTRRDLEAQAVKVAEGIAAKTRAAIENLRDGRKPVFPDIDVWPGAVAYAAVVTRGSSHLYRVHGTASGEGAQWRATELDGDFWFPTEEKNPERQTIVLNAPLPGIGRTLHVREAFYQRGKLVGWIHVGTPIAALTEIVSEVSLLTGIAALPAILLSGVISIFFAQQITKPIRTLQSYAQSVSAGLLNARVTVATNDEFQDLADTLNLMVENLQASRHKLKNSLEQKQAMREQEILLREIHHRVKNNMQILTSLLRLQTRRAESEPLRQVLRESESRIRSMGLLHEKLYQSESVSEIDFAGYLHTLTSELVRMNTPQGEKREVRLAVHGIKLGLDTALPCGLIVTELVSNSLKYAFTPGNAGVILISLSKTKEGEYTLVVWDNGVGLPKDYADRQTNSLGTRLVTMLTDQLNGTLTVDGERGTRTEIRFKESHYRNRI